MIQVWQSKLNLAETLIVEDNEEFETDEYILVGSYETQDEADDIAFEIFMVNASTTDLKANFEIN